ncbi:uncharacterized protein Pyn_25451 [Prunus yedoensis var. nudiflora]|uniref:Mitochondrial import inner membrane translocase subunit TIM50 n=1 Tax=Prunus yedoensis var. nudiflora TaxID=2094558 RepID=A0A314UGL3_PRUYE|nr:uncharacterized protein Pyn_25451 [Prunus yedoensis var. nudiflora]
MKQKNGKKRRKICESIDESCDPSGDTSLVENIIPGADPYLQPPLAILSEQELEVPQILLEDSTFQEKNEDNEQNKRSNASGNNDTDHDIQVSKLDPTNIQDITDIEQTETKTEVPSLPPLAVKADVDVAVNVKEGNLSQISDCAAERSLVSCSKKKLLILDINGLLADIVPQEFSIPKRYKPDITISRKAVFKRPFCDDFLQFCFDRFNVGVWSSRTKKNVDMVVDFLLGDSRHKLLFCWGEYNESNTLLLDDSPYKALRNPANTAIFPYSYECRDRRDASLGPGGKIRSFLEGLAMADNVQKYVEQHPFGQRPITKSSLSWGFYRRVIEDEVESPKD